MTNKLPTSGAGQKKELNDVFTRSKPLTGMIDPISDEPTSCVIAEPTPLSPIAFLDDLRMEVCEAFYFEGPEAALLAVANASMMLAHFIVADELLATMVWDVLQEVSENLTLTRVFGQDALQEAMAFGPRIYRANQRRAA